MRITNILKSDQGSSEEDTLIRELMSDEEWAHLEPFVINHCAHSGFDKLKNARLLSTRYDKPAIATLSSLISLQAVYGCATLSATPNESTTESGNANTDASGVRVANQRFSENLNRCEFILF